MLISRNIKRLKDGRFTGKQLSRLFFSILIYRLLLFSTSIDSFFENRKIKDNNNIIRNKRYDRTLDYAISINVDFSFEKFQIALFASSYYRNEAHTYA